MNTASENLKKRFEELQKKKDQDKVQTLHSPRVSVDVVLEKIQQAQVKKDQDLEEMMDLFEKTSSKSRIKEVGKEENLLKEKKLKEKALEELIDIYSERGKTYKSPVSTQKN